MKVKEMETSKQQKRKWVIEHWNTVIDLDRRNSEGVPQTIMHPREIKLSHYDAIKHYISIIENGVETVLKVVIIAPDYIGWRNVPRDEFEEEFLYEQEDPYIGKGPQRHDYNELVMVELEVPKRECEKATT